MKHRNLFNRKKTSKLRHPVYAEHHGWLTDEIDQDFFYTNCDYDNFDLDVFMNDKQM